MITTTMILPATPRADVMAESALTASTSHSEVVRVQPNTLGRDFVVGDLHGHYAPLMQLMAAVNFDRSVDRLFAVGDLVDRGPNSLACINLLEQPWFYSVLGNHEDVCLQAAKLLVYKTPDEWNADDLILLNDYKELYEGAWLFELDMTQLLALIPLLSALPVIISVGDAQQQCHIVHAELQQVAGRDIMDSDIESWLATPIPEKVHAHCLSGRELINAAKNGAQQTMRPGLSLTYCGHSAVRYKLQHASHRFIDSGGGFPGGWFSLLELNTDRLVIQRA